MRRSIRVACGSVFGGFVISERMLPGPGLRDAGRKLAVLKPCRVLRGCVARYDAESSTHPLKVTPMPTPVRASDTPFAIAVEAGKDYYWCSCGQSKNQPFCDGTHKVAAEFTPVKYTAAASTTVYFCGCKASANAPLCDGTHKKPVQA